MIPIITLGDGSTVAKTAFFTTRLSIEDLVKNDTIALLELVNKCNNVGYKFISPESATILIKCGFMLSKDSVHDDVKKIVLNCLKVTRSGDNISVTFTYPSMQSKTVSKLELKKQGGA
jgi:hypothetical protein